MNRKLPTLLILLTALFCGCGRQAAANGDSVMPPAGSLPGLRSAADKNLRDEYARIVEEGGTPEQLNKAASPPKNQTATTTATSPKDQPGVVLKEIFSGRKLPPILAKSDLLFPIRGFAFDPIALQQAQEFRQKYDSERLKVRAALQQRFDGFGIDFTAGFAADMTAVDTVRLACRLEAFQAAETLAEDNVSGAIQAFSQQWRWISRLAAEKHPVVRLQAAAARADALRVLQAIVSHESITQKQLEQLRQWLQAELVVWPSDAGAWIGDRSLGMNAYELIRQGEIIGLLTPEEINDFVNEGIAEKDLTEATERTADADELYYLETMRKIIDGCGKPYFARAGVFSEIQADLQKKRGTPTYPLVAARLLLPNIEAGHKAQARDRAYCEAWSLALALACGNETPPPGVNPLSGKEYRCSKKDGRVEVRGIELNESDETPIVIPLPK